MGNVWLLIKVYFRVGVLNETAYRANFWIQLIQTFSDYLLTFGTVAIVFSQTDELAGWQSLELVTLLGVYFLIRAVVNLVVQPSLGVFMEGVRDGMLDYTLTKPADSQLLISISEFRIWKLIDVVFALGVAITALYLHAGTVGWLQAGAFGITLLSGAAIVYAVLLMLATLSFWFIRVENIMQIFWSMFLTGRWPVTIYPAWLRWVVTFVVPIAFAVTVPAEAVTGRLDVTSMFGSIGLAILLLIVSRLFWKIGIRHYSGASA